MEIIVSGRHFVVSDELRRHAEARLQPLGQQYPKVTTARLVLEMERSWQIAEVRLTGKQLELEASGRTQDMYKSIDEAVAKLDKQLRKHVDRMHDRKGAVPLSEATASEGGPGAEEA